MKRSKVIFKRSAMLGAVVAVIICAVGAEALKTPLNQPSGATQVDTIVIDTLARFGAKDKPPVSFPHDLHTQALAKHQKDCFTCHLKESVPPSAAAGQAAPSKERMSIKFKRLKDTTPREVRGIYHENCIGCHTGMAGKGDESGPVICGECHRASGARPDRQPAGMDNSLHYRHTKATQNKCETCHHAYDEKAKKLFYAKGQEGTCRYCHQKETVENRISMPLASHLSCVECHRLGKEKKAESGPVTCAGCHDSKEQMKIKKVAPVPRMERQQPDVVLVKALGKGENAEAPRMNPVPFDHKSHEGYSDTCRACHHAGLSACNSCHALGKPLKDGNYVKLDRAMHQGGVESSCIGCHQAKQQARECAGCHVFMPKGLGEQSDACLKCHMKPPADAPAWPKTAEEEKGWAGKLLQSRQPVKGTYPQAEIPENVVIKDLVDRYEQVILPHRKIVSGLVERMNGSKQASRLAAYFHNNAGTVCQGCHHYSPESQKPPKCANCHGNPFDEGNLMKPGLLGAYHQQCMGCHDSMGIEKPKECVECHKERKK
jgi:hypothetical protein